MTEGARKLAHPDRCCNGGPNGFAWCGRPATVVCTAKDGLQWFACDNTTHQEKADTEAIDVWFDRNVFG